MFAVIHSTETERYNSAGRESELLGGEKDAFAGTVT
jgi:hypothetical protein